MAGEIGSMGQEIFYGDWKQTIEDWDYESADDPIYVVHAAGDVRADVQLGWRLRLVQSGEIKQFIIVHMGYVGGYTKLYLYGGSDYDLTSDQITERYYSPAKAPLGFPIEEEKWCEVNEDGTDYSVASPVAGTWYNEGIALPLPIGRWKVFYEAQLKAVIATAGPIDMFTTLSTTTSTETDQDWTAKIAAEDVKSLTGPVHVENPISLAAKATYRLLIKTSCAGLSSINLEGYTVRRSQLRAVCAYL